MLHFFIGSSFDRLFFSASFWHFNLFCMNVIHSEFLLCEIFIQCYENFIQCYLRAFQLLNRAEEMLVVISQTANGEMTLEQLVLHYSSSKVQLDREHRDLREAGADLVDRLQQPILMEDGLVQRLLTGFS